MTWVGRPSCSAFSANLPIVATHPRCCGFRLCHPRMNSMGPLRFLTWRNAEGYRLGHARTSSGTKGSQGFLQMRPVRIELFDDIVQRTARAETLLITVIMTDAQFGKFPAEIAIAGV